MINFLARSRGAYSIVLTEMVEVSGEIFHDQLQVGSEDSHNRK